MKNLCKTNEILSEAVESLSMGLNEASRGRIDNKRIRKIIKMAAAETDIKSIKAWLLNDARGFFEKQVRHWWDIAQNSVAFNDVSDEEVDNQIALMILYKAIDAEAKDLAKQKRKRVKF